MAQSNKADSLQRVLAKHPQVDTFRINRLIELADELGLNLSPDDSIAQQALRLAHQLHYIPGEVKALTTLATNASYEDVSVSQQYAQQALLLAQTIQDRHLLMKVYLAWISANMTIPVYRKQVADNFARSRTLARQLGDDNALLEVELTAAAWYSNQGNYPAALQFGLAGLSLSQKSTVSSALRIETLHRLAYQYSQLKDYKQAILFMRQALSLADASANSFIKNVRKPIIQTNLGNLYVEMGQYAQANQWFSRVLQIRNVSPLLKQYTELSLAEANEREGHYAAAFQTAFLLLPKFEQAHNDNFVYSISETISRAYLHTNRPDSAVFYGAKVIRYYQKIQFKEGIRDQSEILSQAYARLHDLGKAYHYLQTFMRYRDSLSYEEFKMKTTLGRFNEQLRAQKSRVAFLDKTRQLEAQAARRQQILFYVILASLLLLAMLAYRLFRNNQQKQKANTLLSHQKQQIEQTLTKLHATQQQLIQKEKLASLGELTAGIAHEIQNPLNFVNNFSEVSTELLVEQKEALAKGDTKEAQLIADDLSSNLQKIHHHGGRASSIVKGMLEHSRTGTGDRQPTDLNALVDEYLRLAYHGQRAKDTAFTCELITHFDPYIGQVNLIPQEIGRVLLNLFSNAFYAVRERQNQAESNYIPTVTVTTTKTREGVQIRIADNATGMSKSVLQKIFQPFFTTKPTGEGTGLGLSLSYDIITKGHGGSLQVESQEGKGTEFVMSLPD